MGEKQQRLPHRVKAREGQELARRWQDTLEVQAAREGPGTEVDRGK